MTITTAKLARAVALAWAPLLAAPGAHAVDLAEVKSTISGLEAAKPSANSWRIVPLLDVSQIFTDNVNTQPGERAHSQFLTAISPGVLVSRKGPRLVLDGQYQYHYYANAHEQYGTRRSVNQLRANARAELVEDMLFVDARATALQRGISPFGQQVSDNSYSSANSANVKTWYVSPYLVNRFGRVARSELRYVRDSVDAGNSGLASTDGDTLSFRLNSGVAWNDFGWGISASEQRIDHKVRNDSTIKQGSVNLSYQLFPTLGLTAAVMHDDYDYEAVGGANGGRGWSTGFRWTPSRRTSLQASWGHRYYGPSRVLNATHRSRRTLWTLSYDDAVVTTRANFLLPDSVTPGTVGPGVIPGSLGDLFTPGVPDVVGLPPTGLPPSLPGGINFFSNRFSLQKQLRASMAWRGGRSNLVASAFHIRREALSVREVDGEILGNPIDTVNDNIDQVGVNGVLTYRLAPRSNLVLSASVTDNESIITGFKARSHATRLSLRHQLGRNMTGVAELRRASGATGVTTGAKYTENALSVSLNMKL